MKHSKLAHSTTEFRSILNNFVVIQLRGFANMDPFNEEYFLELDRLNGTLKHSSIASSRSCSVLLERSNYWEDHLVMQKKGGEDGWEPKIPSFLEELYEKTITKNWLMMSWNTVTRDTSQFHCSQSRLASSSLRMDVASVIATSWNASVCASKAQERRRQTMNSVEFFDAHIVCILPENPT